MATKTDTHKTFDCVEFKRLAQEQLRAKYETRKAEFDSYAEFLCAMTDEDDWSASIWNRAQGGSGK